MSAKLAIPMSDLEVLDLAKTISGRWINEPNYLLSYMTAADFQNLVNDYEQSFNTRNNDGNARASITAELNQLDKTINGNVKYIKAYLDEKYDTTQQIISKYGQFGIERVGLTYKIPTDRNTRKGAVAKILTGLVAEGFGTKKYGTAFWTPIATRYTFLCKQAIDTDGAVSVEVNSKTNYKKEIRKVLIALHALIKLQNPTTYKGELRSWGFQKEKM